MSVTSQVRPAQDEEQPARPDRRRTIALLVAGGVVLALLGTWLVAFSPLFGVRSVDVRGTHLLSGDEVRAAAAIRNGTPLVRLDTAAVTRRVERLPDVASAQVSTSFPSTVVITVDERIAVGYVLRGSQKELVDRAGVEYRAVSRTPAGLPKLIVPSGAPQAAVAAAEVAAALPAQLRAQVRSVAALDPQAITLVLTRDRVVRWGSVDRTAEKARLLPVLLRHQVSSVDLTNPDQPFTR
ncbi:MAG TPA: FtsQ-type POTRA domain-containing protein [Jatrophihabitans sp.]|nr:FtsQ-type POTRA domain-containing protein [Jatrophihabitans sp.]